MRGFHSPGRRSKMRAEYSSVVDCGKAGMCKSFRLNSLAVSRSSHEFRARKNRRAQGTVAMRFPILYCLCVWPCSRILAEFAVSTLLPILLVVFFSLAVLLAAGSLAIQGYIYSEPVGDIFWRAPAAAAVLTAFLGFWCYLNYRARDPKAQELPSEALFTSAGGEDTSQAERELWVERAGGKTHYHRYTISGVVDRHEYHDSNNKRLAHDKSVEAIIVKEGDPKQPVEVRFVAKHDEDKYVEEGG